MQEQPIRCPDCEKPLDRRQFVKLSGAAAVAAATVTWPSGPRSLLAKPTPQSSAETAVQRFYATLSDAQKATICFPFDHEKRQHISANWAITDPRIGSDFYSKEQRALISEVFRNTTSEDGYERFLQQMLDDDGGMDEYSVAVFGEPGSGKFEWEMTGRHLTIRADGDSVENVAFGGPIVYGHGEETPGNNLFHYQTKQANEVFAALDPDQRKRALLSAAPRENEVPIQGDSGKFPGVPVADLSEDQKSLFQSVVKTILAPYRQEDVDEVLAILKATGGFDQLHLAFYQEDDLESDSVWDIWRVEGPAFVWHFRGAPHVHAYVNIGVKS